MLRRPLAVLLTALMLPSLPVRPRSFGLVHSWYPQYCCQDDDWRTADRIEKLPDGSMGVDAGSMHVFIPRGFLQQPSRDNDAHVWPTRCLLDNTCRGASFYLEPSNQGAPGRFCIWKGALPKSHGLQVIALFDGLGRAHRPQTDVPASVRCARSRVDRWHGPAASRGRARMLRLHRHYPPVARVANGVLSRFAEKRRTQSSSPRVVSVLISSSNSSGSVGQSPRSSRRSLLMALTQSRPAIGPST